MKIREPLVGVLVLLGVALVTMMLIVRSARSEEGPWGVEISSRGDCPAWNELCPSRVAYPDVYSRKIICHEEAKEGCQDIAFALNHAHSLRMEEQQPVIHEPEPITTPCTSQSPDGCTDSQNQKGL